MKKKIKILKLFSYLFLINMYNANANANANEYVFKLNEKSLKSIEVTKPIIEKNIEDLSKYLINKNFSYPANYGCNNFLNCVSTVNNWTQNDGDNLALDIEFNKKVKLTSFDWFYNLGEPNGGKYPSKVDIYFYDENNLKNFLLTLDLYNSNKMINLNIISIGYYSKYHLYFRETPDYGYIAFQYFNFNGRVE